MTVALPVWVPTMLQSDSVVSGESFVQASNLIHFIFVSTAQDNMALRIDCKSNGSPVFQLRSSCCYTLLPDLLFFLLQLSNKFLDSDDIRWPMKTLPRQSVSQSVSPLTHLPHCLWVRSQLAQRSQFPFNYCYTGNCSRKILTMSFLFGYKDE